MRNRHLLGVRVEKAYLGVWLLAGNQSFIDGIGADGRGDVTTIAPHIDQGLLDAYLAKGKVDINARLGASADDCCLAGQGGGTSQPINLTAIGVRTAKGCQDGPCPCFGIHRKVLVPKEDPPAGAASHNYCANSCLHFNLDKSYAHMERFVMSSFVRPGTSACARIDRARTITGRS